MRALKAEKIFLGVCIDHNVYWKLSFTLSIDWWNLDEYRMTGRILQYKTLVARVAGPFEHNH